MGPCCALLRPGPDRALISPVVSSERSSERANCLDGAGLVIHVDERQRDGEADPLLAAEQRGHDEVLRRGRRRGEGSKAGGGDSKW